MVEYTVWTASQRKLPTINEIVPCLGQYIAWIHDWIKWVSKRAGSRNSSSSSRKSKVEFELSYPRMAINLYYHDNPRYPIQCHFKAGHSLPFGLRYGYGRLWPRLAPQDAVICCANSMLFHDNPRYPIQCHFKAGHTLPFGLRYGYGRLWPRLAPQDAVIWCANPR